MALETSASSSQVKSNNLAIRPPAAAWGRTPPVTAFRSRGDRLYGIMGRELLRKMWILRYVPKQPVASPQPESSIIERFRRAET